jgi:hypothetical protein
VPWLVIVGCRWGDGAAERIASTAALPGAMPVRRSYTGPIDGRLSEAKLDQLRAWGTGLSAHDSPDVRATGKAILMLIEEIERLHVDLWSAKAASPEGQPQLETIPAPLEPSIDLEESGQMAKTLRARLRALRPHA